eukprot:TRINITY_DN2202_c2_g1_i1.p1 TRINITY_DN2202_c2_g1~~TRINITY_DN2202_c2_g1_i1.p1  ORF type:complete len:630 (+),score=208.99 TRINITY_DN2202_c2_g1_i1:155-2044(+)
MLLAAVLTSAVGLYSGLLYNRDIQDYVTTRNLIVEAQYACFEDPVDLNVDQESLTLINCRNAAKTSSMTYIINADVCWGSANVSSTGTVCGKVFKVLTYTRPYSKGMFPPRLSKDEPLDIMLSATITKLNRMDIKAQIYAYSMYFREEWFDLRLQWDPADFGNQSYLNWSSTSNEDIRRFLWASDIFWPKATSIENPESDESFTVRYDGYVLRSRFLQLTSFCEMNLRYYPFDYQNCLTDVESYSYDKSDMNVTISPNYTVLNLDTNSMACSVCRVNTVQAYKMEAPSYRLVTKYYRGIEFSGVRWVFTFSRAPGQYFIAMFLPLWLICTLSMGSCWIDTSAATARVSMGITTVLVLLTQINGQKGILPDTRYITCLDVYLLLCLTLVVTNVCEYGVLNFFTNRLNGKEADMKLKRKYIMMKLEDSALQGEKTLRDKPYGADESISLFACFGDGRLDFTDKDDEEEGQEGSKAAKDMESSGSAEAGSEPIAENTTPLPEEILKPEENAFLKDCFKIFASKTDKTMISAEKLRPLLMYIGLPKEHIITLLRDVKTEGYISYPKLAREIKKQKIFEDYGVKAIRIGGFGVTTSTLVRVEEVYRIASITFYVSFNIIWFVTVFILSVQQKED